MKRSWKRIAGAVAVMLVFPLQTAFALTETQTPQLPKMETPKLSQDYNQMLDGLSKEGFGNYQFEQGKPLPLPQVEAPEGTGKDAYSKFVETYGDMWNDPAMQLDKSSAIPEGLDAPMQAFGADMQAIMGAAREGDGQLMQGMLAKQLDKSGLWDLNGISSQLKSGLMSAGDAQGFVNSMQPSGAYESILGAVTARQPGDSQQFLGGLPDPRGYRQSTLLESSVSSIGDVFVGSESFQAQKAALDTARDQNLQQIAIEKQQYGQVTPETKAKGLEITLAEARYNSFPNNVVYRAVDLFRKKPYIQETLEKVSK